MQKSSPLCQGREDGKDTCIWIQKALLQTSALPLTRFVNTKPFISLCTPIFSFESRACSSDQKTEFSDIKMSNTSLTKFQAAKNT